MDVRAVYNGMTPVVDYCRNESRPFFVDMRTYRFKGHSMSDPRKYRTKDEESKFESEDPIDKLAAHLKHEGVISDDDYKSMLKEIRKEVRDSIKWAEESPEPPLEELYHDVYVERWGPFTGTSLPQMLREKEAE